LSFCCATLCIARPMPSYSVRLARLNGQIYVVCPSIVRLSACPSHGHISKTKQDRPQNGMEHHIEVGTADSIGAFRSSLSTCTWGYSRFQMLKSVFEYSIARIIIRIRPLVRLCCQYSATVSTCYQHSSSLCWQRESRAWGRPASYRSSGILVCLDSALNV